MAPANYAASRSYFRPAPVSKLGLLDSLTRSHAILPRWKPNGIGRRGRSPRHGREAIPAFGLRVRLFGPWPRTQPVAAQICALTRNLMAALRSYWRTVPAEGILPLICAVVGA